MAPYTTMRVGGPARLFLEPRCAEEIADALEACRKAGFPSFVMGLGSNLIVSDRGFDGLVIRLGDRFSGVEWGNTGCARAKAGTALELLVDETVEKGCAGIQRLAGIPGSLGGAVCMNAGAFEQCVSEILEAVTFFNDRGCLQTVRKADLAFSYRKSPFQRSQRVILEAEFHFPSGSPSLLAREKNEILAKRRAKQPWEQPSAGSVFHRPPGHFAGSLIEKAGLKGKRMGGAMVSQKHAGFIVNTGNATAQNVHDLASAVQQEVMREFHVALEPEVVFLGDF